MRARLSFWEDAMSRVYQSRALRRAAGLCALCGEPAERYRCEACLVKQRASKNATGKRGDNRRALSERILATFTAVFEQRGVVTSRSLALALGCDQHRASTWMSNAEFRGQVVRVKHGKYALPSPPGAMPRAARLQPRLTAPAPGGELTSKGPRA